MCWWHSVKSVGGKQHAHGVVLTILMARVYQSACTRPINPHALDRSTGTGHRVKLIVKSAVGSRQHTMHPAPGPWRQIWSQSSQRSRRSAIGSIKCTLHSAPGSWRRVRSQSCIQKKNIMPNGEQQLSAPRRYCLPTAPTLLPIVHPKHTQFFDCIQSARLSAPIEHTGKSILRC